MTNEKLHELWSIFKSLGASALSLNHYNLAEITTEDNSQLWKEFLMEPEVADWIRTETNLIQESELKKMIQDISTSRSVGRAQLINSLTKLTENRGVKEGPTFIYTFVPLSTEQAQAENVVILEKDPFLKDDPFPEGGGYSG